MSQTKAHPDHGVHHEKKHEEPVAASPEAAANPIPAPEEGPHARSHAAHLQSDAREHTMQAGDIKHGMTPGALKQPPEVMTRVGKQHRD